MSEVQEAITKGKCEINPFRLQQNFSRRAKANCCGG